MGLLFAMHSISNALTDSFRNWKSLLGVLLNELSQHPIRLIDEKGNIKPGAQKLHSQMIQRRLDAGFRPDLAPLAFYFTDQTAEPAAPGRPPGIYWNVVLKQDGPYTAQLNGVLVMDEVPSAFVRP